LKKRRKKRAKNAKKAKSKKTEEAEEEPEEEVKPKEIEMETKKISREGDVEMEFN